MKMDKVMCKAVADRIKTLVAEQIKAEFGLEVNRGPAKYDEAGMTLKMEIRVPVAKLDVKTPEWMLRGEGGQMRADYITGGLAPVGTKVQCGANKCTILKARKTKYVVAIEGKQGDWLVPMARCKAI